MTMNRDVVVVAPLHMLGLDAVGQPFNAPLRVEWSELPGVLGSARPSTVVLAGLASADGSTSFSRIEALLHEFPSVTVVAVAEVFPDALADISALLAAGLSDVLDPTQEGTPRAVGERLRQAHARPFKRRLEEVMPPRLSSDARQLLMAAAEVAADGGGAASLAKLLGCPARQITNRFISSGLPTPHQVQTWMRILLACALLEDRGRTSSGVAAACGYPRPTSMQRSLRRAGEELRGRRKGKFISAASAFFARLGSPQRAEVLR